MSSADENRAAGTSLEPEALCLREIRTLTELEHAEGSWNRLIERAEDATPFQTWEWIFEFARYDPAPLRIAVFATADGDWAGVLPLCERRSMIPGIGGLELIGGRLSDYPGLLAVPRWRPRCEELARAWLGALEAGRILQLRSQRDGLPSWAPRRRFKVLSAEDTVVVRLPAAAEDFAQTLSTKFRGDLRRSARKLAEHGPDFRTPQTEADLRTEIRVLFDLHQARKNSQGERGRFFEPRWRQALTEIAVRLLRRGMVRLTVLRIGGVPAAASLDLRLHRTQYAYQYGMNPDLVKLSPGKLLTWRMLQDAIASGMQAYDFGRGLEEYKLRWSKELRRVEDLVVGASTPLLETWLAVQRAHGAVLRNRVLKSLYLSIAPRRKAGRPAGYDRPQAS